MSIDSYPYMVSNNKIEPILAKIRSAAKPDRLTMEMLKKWGFPSSNDRAILRVLKALDIIEENNGTPTPHYDQIRDETTWRYVLGDRIRDAYSDLFAIDEKIYSAPENEVKGAISRVTGKDAALVARFYSTFKTLAGLAKFDGDAKRAPIAPVAVPSQETVAASTDRHSTKTSLHYNIQLHLPATTDVTVYNAIFKSMREVLGL